MFHVGDHVVSKYYGRGIVDYIADPMAKFQYPVRVRWKRCKNYILYGYFTRGGRHYSWRADPEYDIVLVEEEDSMKFHEGDRVFAPFHGYGTIVEIDETDRSYPITVRWDESRYKIGIDLSTFTADGYLFFRRKTENTKITKVEGEKMGHLSGVVAQNDESTVERMEDALHKKVEDAVNPAHYKVEGLTEAIDIINHLMHREQYEGFLWGNILKYAYRFGRKGDKAETAGKIEWYAKKLKELEEERK